MAQVRQAARYNQWTCKRQFNEGDWVLVLLPDDTVAALGDEAPRGPRSRADSPLTNSD